MPSLKNAGSLLAVLLLGSATLTHAAEAPQVRLYAMDCGAITANQLGLFADTGEYDGKKGELAAPCFLIRHPKGVLLWDTGLSDALAAQKDGVTNGPFHMQVKVTLSSQLVQLGLAPKDITYMAFSHFHFDHLGNATQFPAATWILNKAELDAANASPEMFDLSENFRKVMQAAKQQVIRGDHDVFGDGTVRILKAPGHTPGHQVLAVKLPKTGNVVLSGDLYHLRDNRQFHRVPTFNYNRADTLASFDRIETIVDNLNARFVVQHDPVDFKGLPKFPAFLD